MNAMTPIEIPAMAPLSRCAFADLASGWELLEFGNRFTGPDKIGLGPSGIRSVDAQMSVKKRCRLTCSAADNTCCRLRVVLESVD